MEVKKILFSQLEFKLDPIVRAIESRGWKKSSKLTFPF